MSSLQPINEAVNAYNNEETVDEGEIIQLVGLKLGEEEYAIDVLKIQEIIRPVDITIVPRTDHFVLGVMNLRGKVIPVVDLRVRFALDKMDFDKETRIIVVRFDNENIGFVVDEVTEVIRIKKSMVEPTPPLVGTIGQEYILGICKYGDRLIILLDIDSVISDGKTVESDLRKRFLGIGTDDDKPSIDYDKVAEQAAVPEDVPALEHDTPEAEAVIQDEELNQDSSGDASADDGVGDDIDALIAKELAQREKETEELLAKKKDEEQDNGESDDVNDILNDALNQNKSVDEDLEHVEQGELDDLIAKELEKREKETEELLAKKKAENKLK